MAKSMDIPQDIIDNVIAAVGDNTRLLKQCSLVSSSFLFPSRKRLFSKIIIRNDEICEGIHQLLIENPFIQPCVRSITINGSTYFGWVNSRSLLVILQLPLCCIENFAIILPRIEGQLWDSMDWNHDSDAWDWNYFGDEMRGVLWNIMLSSTLKTLCLSGISNLPISFFLHVAPLSVLELDSLSPNDFHEDYSSLLTQTPSDGAIDLCVWRFEDEHMRYEIPFICLFLLNSRMIEKGITRLFSGNSCHSCAVYADLKSALTSIPEPIMTFISCPSSCFHFPSASQLLPYSNTWSSIFGFSTQTSTFF